MTGKVQACREPPSPDGLELGPAGAGHEAALAASVSTAGGLQAAVRADRKPGHKIAKLELAFPVAATLMDVTMRQVWKQPYSRKHGSSLAVKGSNTGIPP